MPVIIKNPFFNKKNKDATITPDKVLRGEIGYGNNNERIVGTHICKKKYQVLKFAKGEGISMANTNGEYLQDFDRCAHYTTQTIGDSPQGIFMSVGKDFDDVAILQLGKRDSSTYATVIKSQSVNAKYEPNTNLFVTIDGIRLNIFLGRPFNNSYRHMAPASFTNKNIFSLKFSSEYLEYAAESSGAYRDRLYFYLKTDQGIITEFGIAMKNHSTETVYMLHDIEFGIEWI